MMNPFEVVRNLNSLKAQAEELKKKAVTLKATGYAMGNMIEAVVNGEFKVESLKIDPSLLTESNKEMLEVLTVSAVNSAMESMKVRLSQELGMNV